MGKMVEYIIANMSFLFRAPSSLLDDNVAYC